MASLTEPGRRRISQYGILNRGGVGSCRAPIGAPGQPPFPRGGAQSKVFHESRNHPLLAGRHARRREGSRSALRDVSRGRHFYPRLPAGNGPDQIRRHRVIPTFINALPRAARMYKTYLPLMPLALEQCDLRGYDLVISSESGRRRESFRLPKPCTFVTATRRCVTSGTCIMSIGLKPDLRSA